MESRQSKCPYCKETTDANADSCAICREPFPWSAQLAEVSTQLKERDTNRLRTTLTLINEAHKAYTGGPPVSPAAIRGFALSWLLPRTVIVIGSIAGIIILGIQTYILWSQTRLISQQAAASRTDQADRLRERMAHSSSLLREAKDFEKLQMFWVWSCTAQSCPEPKELIADLLWPKRAERLAADRLDRISEFSRFKDRLSPFLKLSPQDTIHHDFNAPPGTQRFNQLEDRFLRPALHTCLAMPEDVSGFTQDATASLALLAALQPIEHIPDRMAVRIALGTLVSANGTANRYGVNQFSEELAQRLTVEDFTRELELTNSRLSSAWSKIVSACKSTQERSRELIQVLDRIGPTN